MNDHGGEEIGEIVWNAQPRPGQQLLRICVLMNSFERTVPMFDTCCLVRCKRICPNDTRCAAAGGPIARRGLSCRQGATRPVLVGNSILLATDIESGDAPALCERS